LNVIAVKKAVDYLDFNENNWFIPPAYGSDHVFSFRTLEQLEQAVNLSPLWGQGAVKVCSNPADHLLNISFNSGEISNFNGALQIVDNTGRVVLINELNGSVQVISINTTDWASGMYQCIITGNNKQWLESIEIIH